jgi:RimJ/RimL family protein N-acetyltransferase
VIVVGADVIAFVALLTGQQFEPPTTAIGRTDDEGQIVAGIVFNCWTGPDIELTVAALPGGVSRALLRRAAAYVFDEHGCIRASFTTESQEVVDLALRLGAQTEGRKRHLFGPGRDGVILGILREDWKLG